jgi:hypothetical protein
MEMDTIKTEIQTIGESLFSKTKTIECYVFGSILTNPKKAMDIDILIIYENQVQLEIIKQEFKLMAKKYPLHINYFTFSEEREFNFIEQQGAQKVFSF